MQLYRRIDKQGMFVEDVLLDNIPYLTETITNEDGTTQEITHDTIPNPFYIETPCPQGFYQPKWNDTEWIEGGNVSNIISSQLENAKRSKIELSKSLLDTYLVKHPLLFIDGKYYSVTRDKQNLLNNAISIYQMKIQLGIVAELKWNATGEECAVWSLENVVSLALAIAEHVEPIVSKQRSYEVQINSCTTLEEIEGIVIDYEAIA